MDARLTRAFYEAGRAVIGSGVPMEVVRLTLDAEGRGRCDFRYTPDGFEVGEVLNEEQAHARRVGWRHSNGQHVVAVSLAGRMAVERAGGNLTDILHEPIDALSMPNVAGIITGSGMAEGTFEPSFLLRPIESSVRDTLDTHWAAVERIAAELVDSGELSGRRVRELVGLREPTPVA